MFISTPLTRLILIAGILINASRSFGQNSFPFISEPLSDTGDLSVRMVEAVDRFLINETKHLASSRADLWKYDFSSVGGFNTSIEKHRMLLANRLGVVEKRLGPGLFILNDDQLQPLLLKTADVLAMAVRWETLDGMPADGILLKPKGKIHARIVMLPDADILPEVLAGIKEDNGPGFGAAQQLANAGCEVLIPLLINRNCSYAGSASLNRFTNQPHREWIYRQAYELGRHVIGYELQKIFAAIDWFELQNKKEHNNAPIGVAGYGEGNDRPEGDTSRWPSYIGDVQLEWLEKDLATTRLPVIVFCHQGLDVNVSGAIQYSSRVRVVFERANEAAGWQKVQVVFSGHHHQDYHNIMNSIHYIQINSMSYYWMGSQYRRHRYSGDIDKKFPLVKDTAPYKDPIWAVLDIYANGEYQITGRRTEFLSPSPGEMGMREFEKIYPVVPVISDRKFKVGNLQTR